MHHYQKKVQSVVSISSKIVAVIPIGGKGTRLKKIIGNIPKPIYQISGKSTLLRICEILKSYGIKNIIITIGYESIQCINHINEIKKNLNLNIDFYQEKIPLGESGSLWKIQEKLSDHFLFINGDLIFSLDFSRLYNFHFRLKSDLTLVTHTSSHPYDSDLVSTPTGSLVEKLYLKNNKEHSKVNAYLGFSGIAMVNKKVLSKIEPPKDIKVSSLFQYLAKNAFDNLYRIYSYNTSEYIKDMGTPARLEEVKKAIINNTLNIKNYSNKQNALFIDRDNTLLKCDIGEYILSKTKVTYLIKNIKNLALLAKKYSLVVLVTNQPQISMGKLTFEQLEIINSKLINVCLEYDLKIDAVAFCPHHPHKGFDLEISILKTDCFCRKPNPGLFYEQAYLRNINLNKSLMIGDSNTDKEAALNSGCDFCFIDEL
mgnify:CR=1 FL=1